jgi:hypothetical protein
MTRATYTDIASAIFAKQDGLKRDQKFIVVPPVEEDMALTVYPPTSYLQDYGIDVFLMGNTAELWQDGYKLRKLNSIQDATVVAEAILEAIENTERIFREEQ